jgi:sulfonate transport system substrate-binding protein
MEYIDICRIAMAWRWATPDQGGTISGGSMHRRNFLLAGLVGTVAWVGHGVAKAAAEFRIGFQKSGVLLIARQQELIERRLAPAGVGVKWVEFPSGPPLLEALNAGGIDFGLTGDTPPIFAQAAGASLVYVAALAPNGGGEGIIVKPDSPIRTLADLKGKRIAFTKGSSANNLTVVAVEKGGLAFTDITPVHLSPADAAAAFARDSVDAWTIWDPYLAIAELRHHPHILVRGQDILTSNTFVLANRDFAARAPGIIVDAIDCLAQAAHWAEANRDKVAQTLAEATGVDPAAQAIAAERARFAVLPLSDDILATQQATADRFYRLGLIPRAIAIRDAVWFAPRS